MRFALMCLSSLGICTTAYADSWAINVGIDSIAAPHSPDANSYGKPEGVRNALQLPPRSYIEDGEQFHMESASPTSPSDSERPN